MNRIYKCFLSLLLIVMITAKLVVPVMQLYKSSLQSDIEQQEQKTSEESNTEKADGEKLKTEVAELALMQRFISSRSTIHSLYSSYFISLLPSRYLAVPTPPPWHSC